MKLFPYLVLIRPANVLTAISDVIAGFAIAGVMGSFTGAYPLPDVPLIILSTIGLYGGGIVFKFPAVRRSALRAIHKAYPTGRLTAVADNLEIGIGFEAGTPAADRDEGRFFALPVLMHSPEAYLINARLSVPVRNICAVRIHYGSISE